MVLKYSRFLIIGFSLPDLQASPGFPPRAPSGRDFFSSSHPAEFVINSEAILFDELIFGGIHAGHHREGRDTVHFG